jgi:hypothetical protein
VVEVVNRGGVVGWLTDHRSDMWYLEGSFTPAETAAGARFAASASALDLRRAYDDPTLAIRALLRESPDSEGIVFLVMWLDNGTLFGRCVFELAAVQWAVEHVPE